MEQPVAFNASLISSGMNVLLAFPRLAQRAGSFALFHMPEALDNVAGKMFNSASAVADATSQHNAVPTWMPIIDDVSPPRSTGAATLDAALREAFTQRGGGDAGSSSLLGTIVQGLGRLKSFGGIFSYLTSRWALATFTAAIILNRTQFYASSREHLRLRWYMRIAIYVIPVAAFVVQLQHILQAVKCQTSPDFPLLRYGDPLRYRAIDFGGEDGFLYQLSSTLLFWQDDATCCAARNMSLVALENDTTQLRGSMSLLFTFFLTLCTSQFFETLACALQGKHPMPETGMTIFEHSLAFAECEAMISSAFGFGFFGVSKFEGSSSSSGAAAATTADKTGPLFSRAEVLQKLNVPPEVLLVCLISCFSHLSSATLAITGIRHKVRLVNTAIWASCYMSAFIWSFLKIVTSPVETITDLGVLRFPTVCIVGFIPHLMILVGIAVCAVIYSIAILITALSIPTEAIPNGAGLGQRFSWAYHNLQANVQFSSSSSIRIKMSEDFYTTLLKVGFSLLTAASEAVYLNEGSRIHVAQTTWLEQKRIDELAANLDKRKAPAVPVELLGDGIAKGVDFKDHHDINISASPYARERKSRPAKHDKDKANSGDLDSGLGIAQRRNRIQLTFDFIAGLFWLVIGLEAQLALGTMRMVGIQSRPSWLLKAAGIVDKHKTGFADDNGPAKTKIVVKERPVDSEAWAKRNLGVFGDGSEETLNENIYNWWKKGPLFGELDSSGDYLPAGNDDDNDDTTSMISTNESTNDDEMGTEESGRQTPTQADPSGGRLNDSLPQCETGLDLTLLSRLLNPQSTIERDEARLLSYSLQSNRPTTRRRYQLERDRSRAQLLRGLRNRNNPQSAEEEELELEQFILDRRSQIKPASATESSWESGAEGMGSSGPQCVVCQSTPRTILVWPCGCLSMCDDCRVGLAARNYTKCICCRTDIAAYSRLYVP